MSLTTQIVKKTATIEKRLEGMNRVEIQKRNQHAWSHACSTHRALPALRAFWSMGSVDYAAASRSADTSGNGYDLGDAGGGSNVEFSYDANNPYAPIAIFNGGANDYLSRADGGAGNWADILGTEAYIRATERGLTLGGWFWFSALPGAAEFLMAKDDVGANRQYYLVTTAANLVQFGVHPGPVVVNSAGTLNTGWNHCIGVYDQPSQIVYTVLNGTVTAGAAGAAPAALNDSGAAFTIGASGAGASRFTGYASLCFLLACSLREAAATFTATAALYAQTRALFGV